jgi:DNA-binding GntR family transcriptional regulator
VKLVDQIEEIVLSGELPAGSKLDEMVLARRFDVSRTPVREALRQLASAGLIDLIPNRGAFIATLTGEQLHEMFIAMAEMEATCARLAAISMTPTERQAFQRLHNRMGELVEPNKVHEFGEMNDAFHILIYRGAHNHYLEGIASRLRKRLSLYRRSQFRTNDRLQHSFAEHDAVVRAVIAGDADRAHAAMLCHFDMVEASVQTLLEDIGMTGAAQAARARG